MLIQICETKDKEANRLVAMNEAQGYKVFTKKIKSKKTGFTQEFYCIDILSFRHEEGETVRYFHEAYISPTAIYKTVESGIYTFETKHE